MDNPYMVGQAPNYSQGLVNFFGGGGGGSQRNFGQQQGQQDPSAGAATQARQGASMGAATNGRVGPLQTFAQYLQKLFGGAPAAAPTYQPPGPMNILDPNSTIPGVGPGGPSGIY